MRTLLLAASLLFCLTASAQTAAPTPSSTVVAVPTAPLDVNDVPLSQFGNDQMQTNIGGTWDWVDDPDLNPSHPANKKKTPWYGGLNLPGLGN